MEAEEARIRRGVWLGRSCVHSEIEQEVAHGSWIGMYVCKECGSEFLKVSLWEAIHRFLQHERDSVLRV